jgi:hypothetical protein
MLASDRPAVAALKDKLNANRATCDLFNMDKLVASLEARYFEMVDDHQEGRTPTPDLTNLDVYFGVGVALDHEATEMRAVPDYHGLYREKFAERSLVRPVPPDRRLWNGGG